MKRSLTTLIALAAIVLAIGGCATVTPDGSLSVDARPNQTYVVVLQDTTTIHTGYGDVTLTALSPGNDTVLASRGDRSQSIDVHVSPGHKTSTDVHVTEEDDSDQPVWAGRDGDRERTPGSGMHGSDTEKGDLFGDLYVLVRDANGAPITIEIAGVDYVQPAAFFADGLGQAAEPVLDVDGNYVPLTLDAEGSLVVPQYYPVFDDPSGALVVPKEVDLGRLNEARAPSNVLDRALAEALTNLQSSVKAITQDPMGRLEYWTDEVTPVAIDSPLENLALYRELMTQGEITFTTQNGALFSTNARPPDFKGNADPVDATADPKHIMLDYAAAMLSAAADKTGDIDVDVAITINNFLGINGETAPEYFDFMGYGHIRSHHFGTDQATVLVQQEDPNSYVISTIDVMAIFNSVDLTSGDARGFAAAANDDLTVLEYVHNYAPPEPL
jgi:hypothetical protein